MDLGYQHTDSLSDVHHSVDPMGRRSPWRRIAAFFGPAYLISVGYMDPGNWATDLQGGSLFGYRLIWVLVLSNLMALLLQSLSARLGIVSKRDLAQCNREVYPKSINYALYGLAELAIAACDLAEVLGMAVGLNLLLHIPLLWGVGVTMLDTILLLYLQKLGMRKLEAFIIALIGIIALCFIIEMILAKPDIHEIFRGIVPLLPPNPVGAGLNLRPDMALYIAIGIIGATVMPHNLYLHSALVQTRKVNEDHNSIKKAIKYNNWDSSIALNMALFVNAAILILAASVFHANGHPEVAALKDAHQLLNKLLGSTWSSHLFAIALIAAGQSSTITGTLAGQIVMEGYLHLRINPLVRRLLTRLIAIIPATLVIWIAGESQVDSLLIFSQVLLSMQLAFAVIPLIHFVSDKKRMGAFAIGSTKKIISWSVAALIIILNVKLVAEEVFSFLTAHPAWWNYLIVLLICLLILFLLGYILIFPFIKHSTIQPTGIHPLHNRLPIDLNKGFETIALALDYSDKDTSVLQYALQMASANSIFVLIHVVESATARRRGADTGDFESIEDQKQLEIYANFFRGHGYQAKAILGYKYRVREIARITIEAQASLLIVGSHGHKAVSDWVFGETINSVRHLLKIPVFIAQ